VIQGWRAALAPWLLAAIGLPGDPPRTIEVLSGSGLSLRLEVRPKASLASVDWLALEFENTSAEAVTIAHAHFRIEAERWNAKTGEPGGSGGLASGNTYDLFPEAWRTTPVSPIVLEPAQTHVVAGHASDYSSALLGLAPRDGWCIRARLHVTVDFEDGRSLLTAAEGMPFEFDWLRPDDSGFATMRSRLKSMLERPEKKATHAYLLGTLLGVEAVSDSISRDELLAALTRRTCSFDGHSAVAEHLARRHGVDRAVIAFVRQGLASEDPSASLVLARAGVWDGSFVEPLVRRYEATADRRWEELSLLQAHRPDWTDTGIPARLSAAARRHHPLIERNVVEVNEAQLEDWARGVQELGMTGDRSMIAALRPVLMDRRSFRSADLLAGADLPLPPLRACDCALEAILAILDGDAHDAYAKAMSVITLVRDDASHAALRDRMIEDLRRRLAGGASK